MIRPFLALPIMMAAAAVELACQQTSADAQPVRQRMIMTGHSVTLDCHPSTAQVGQQRPIKLSSRAGETAPAGTVVSISYYETLEAPLPAPSAQPPVMQRQIVTQAGPHKKTVTWTLQHALTGRQIETTTIMAAMCITAVYLAPPTT